MNKNILVVEDDEGIAEVLEIILTDSGFEVATANSAASFATYLKCYHPDLVLLDIRLPDGDGRDLCRMVKSDTSFTKMPVILMSAHATPSEVMRQACADAFIAKPFDLDFLVNEVTKYTSRAH